MQRTGVTRRTARKGHTSTAKFTSKTTSRPPHHKRGDEDDQRRTLRVSKLYTIVRVRAQRSCEALLNEDTKIRDTGVLLPYNAHTLAMSSMIHHTLRVVRGDSQIQSV